MIDITSINRQFLIMAREAAKTKSGETLIYGAILFAVLAAPSSYIHAAGESYDQGLSDGTGYAKQIAPSSASQLVNPGVVNSGTWGGSTTQSSVPTGFGGFSNPTTDGTQIYGQANAIGLGGIGVQTQNDCAGYIPGTGGSLRDQQCAAVNFMATNCMQITPSQRQIVGADPISSGSLNNCQGTYGQGAAQFNFAGQLSANDPIFGVVSNTNASNSGSAAQSSSQNCTQQTVTTKPAQSKLANCITSDSTAEQNCSLTLDCTVSKPEPVAATPNYGCPAGQTLVGGRCSSPSFAATANYQCNPGDALNGTTCQPPPTTATLSYVCNPNQTVSGNQCLTPSYAATVSYSCSAAGYTLSGTACVSATSQASTNYSCPVGAAVTRTTCSYPSTTAQVNYQCNAGDTLSGTTCQPPPKTATLSYICKAGQTLSGDQCLTPSYDATVSYSCPVAGYSVSGSICVSQVSQATATYSCQSGVLQGTTCVQPAYSASISYQCNPGDALVGTSCQPPATQGPTQEAGGYCPGGYVVTASTPGGGEGITDVGDCNLNLNTSTLIYDGQGYEICYPNDTSITANEVGGDYYTDPKTNVLILVVTDPNGTPCGSASNHIYTCPVGYTLSGSTCYPPSVTPPTYAATPNYSCPAGGTFNGTNCVFQDQAATVNYSCPGSGVLSGTNCYGSAGATFPATANYSCPSGGSLTGTTCVTAATAATASYSCSTGSLSGSSCVQPPYGATTFYTCPAGDALSGTTCTPPATTANISYSCPNSGVLSGTTCYGTLGASYSATATYSCPNGGTVSGTSCVTPATAATASYSCPTGALSGTSCVQPPYGATTFYTCPAGDALSGTTCTPDQTEADVTYSCPPGSKLQGAQCIITPIATCSWIDGCSALSSSAGQPLGAPE